ncbi:MAG: hypothetical protein ACRDRL_12320, partial [Sciscionella sp.]
VTRRTVEAASTRALVTAERAVSGVMGLADRLNSAVADIGRAKSPDDWRRAVERRAEEIASAPSAVNVAKASLAEAHRAQAIAERFGVRASEAASRLASARGQLASAQRRISDTAALWVKPFWVNPVLGLITSLLSALIVHRSVSDKVRARNKRRRRGAGPDPSREGWVSAVRAYLVSAGATTALTVLVGGVSPLMMFAVGATSSFVQRKYRGANRIVRAMFSGVLTLVGGLIIAGLGSFHSSTGLGEYLGRLVVWTVVLAVGVLLTYGAVGSTRWTANARWLGPRLGYLRTVGTVAAAGPPLSGGITAGWSMPRRYLARLSGRGHDIPVVVNRAAIRRIRALRKQEAWTASLSRWDRFVYLPSTIDAVLGAALSYFMLWPLPWVADGPVAIAARVAVGFLVIYPAITRWRNRLEDRLGVRGGVPREPTRPHIPRRLGRHWRTPPKRPNERPAEQAHRILVARAAEATRPSPPGLLPRGGEPDGIATLRVTARRAYHARNNMAEQVAEKLVSLLAGGIGDLEAHAVVLRERGASAGRRRRDRLRQEARFVDYHAAVLRHLRDELEPVPDTQPNVAIRGKAFVADLARYRKERTAYLAPGGPLHTLRTAVLRSHDTLPTGHPSRVFAEVALAVLGEIDIPRALRDEESGREFHASPLLGAAGWLGARRRRVADRMRSADHLAHAADYGDVLADYGSDYRRHQQKVNDGYGALSNLVGLMFEVDSSFSMTESPYPQSPDRTALLSRRTRMAGGRH